MATDVGACWLSTGVLPELDKRVAVPEYCVKKPELKFSCKQNRISLRCLRQCSALPVAP